MLTLKVLQQNGNEYVREIGHVVYMADEELAKELPQRKTPYLLAFPPNPSGLPEEINEGSVYVMNEAGKTVASYNLGKRMFEVGG
jgi:hypothetical protein